MGFYYRLHLHTELAATTPGPLLSWLAGRGPTDEMLAVLPPEEAGWLSELTDHQRDHLTITLEPYARRGGEVASYWLMLAGLVKDDDVMVTYGLAAALAPHAAEGLIGVSWTTQHQESDVDLFLVRGGRFYVAHRYVPPHHIALNGTEPTPWTPFPIGDPEAGRQAEPD